MGKLVKADLEGEISRKVIQILDMEIDKCNKLCIQLQKFCNSTKFKGLDYDEARKKCSEYIDILNSRKEFAESIKKNFSSVCNVLLNFMDTFDILDDSRITEVENNLQNAQRIYNSFVNRLNKIDSASENERLCMQLQSRINTYSVTIEFIKKELKKLQELHTITNFCNNNYIGILKATEAGQKSKINSIQISSIRNYTITVL